MTNRFLTTIALVLMCSLLLTSSVFANHPYSAKTHIASALDSSVDDYFCVDAKDPAIPLTTVDAYSKIKSILYSKNYDGLGNNKIYWLQGGGGQTACADMSDSDKQYVGFRYYIQASTKPLCDGTSSCVKRYGPLSTSNGHNHYSYGIATIRYQAFTNVPDYIINHETGHLLGLLDGGGSNDCPGSIMHSKDYGCTNGYPSNPTQKDLDSVTTEANSG